MFWLDLGLCVFCLWGGVSGYLAGWHKEIRRLMMLAAAAAIALILKGDLKCFITVHYPVDVALKTAIINRFALPVGGSVSSPAAVLKSIGLPALLQAGIYEKAAAAAAPAFSEIAAALAAVMFNALSYAVGVILWWGAFQLAMGWGGEVNGDPSNFRKNISGFMAGLLRQLLLLLAVVGTAAPFLWLAPFPRELFDPQQALFIRWALQIFHETGIWWN